MRKPKDVHRGGQRLLLDLFRTSVGQREGALAGNGERTLHRLLVDQPGDAEVQQLRLAPRIDQDVTGPQVAVDKQVAAVRILHRGADLEKQLRAVAQVQLVSLAPRVDVLTLDVLHRQEGLAVG